ncbi:TolC family protein [Ralstonia insidiosa]|uniref:TolC family protein n=1 Tax=Ralstonia insidiosa TaxID=190721 RepID=UPI003D660606
MLREQAANVAAAGADAAQARAWLNPRVDTVYENLGAPQSGGVSQRQNTYTITQPLEIGGKRSARVEAGQRGLVAAEARERQTRVTYAAELAVAYATAEAMLGRKALAAEDRLRATDDLRAARALVQFGKEGCLACRTGPSKCRGRAGCRTSGDSRGNTGPGALGGAGRLRRALYDAPHLIAGGSWPCTREYDKAGRDAGCSHGTSRAGCVERSWCRSSGRNGSPMLASVLGCGDMAGQMPAGTSWACPPRFRCSTGTMLRPRRQWSARRRPRARLDSVRLEAAAARRSALAQAAASEKRLAAAAEGERAATEAYRLGRIGYGRGQDFADRAARHPARAVRGQGIDD